MTMPEVTQLVDEALPDDDPGGDAVTDAHLAERFAAERLNGRYCWVRGMGWMAWRGDRWASVSEVEAQNVASEWMLAEYRLFTAGAAKDEIKDENSAWLKHLDASHVRGVTTLAAGYVLHKADEFDAHPDLLNCANGVMDLRTGELLPHDPALMLTRSTGVRYVPGATHSDWEQALTAVPDDVRDWHQIRIGQGGTGHMPPDDTILVMQGGGENGKTTIVQGVRHALGDYYVQVPDKALFGDPGQHDTVLMEFKGARIAVVEETPEEGHLNMQRIKVVTSPEITGRRMRMDPVTFKTTHLLIVNTNPEPIVENTDHASWRRLPMIKHPYTYRKPGQELLLPAHRRGDPGLRDRIIAGEQGQHEAVLAWIVEGARRWYEAGRVLPPVPDRVAADTRAWRGRCNLLVAFADQYLEPSTGHHVMADELAEFFDHWLRKDKHRPWSKQTVFKRLTEHAAESGWDIGKRYTRLNLARLSWPTEEALKDLGMAFKETKNSYQAWHGIRYREQNADEQGEADEGTGEPPSTTESSQVSEVSTRSVPLHACAHEKGTDAPETPETSQVSAPQVPAATSPAGGPVHVAVTSAEAVA